MTQQQLMNISALLKIRNQLPKAEDLALQEIYLPWYGVTVKKLAEDNQKTVKDFLYMIDSMSQSDFEDYLTTLKQDRS